MTADQEFGAQLDKEMDAVKKEEKEKYLRGEMKTQEELEKERREHFAELKGRVANVLGQFSNKRVFSASLPPIRSKEVA
jgi:hypothetical protein